MELHDRTVVVHQGPKILHLGIRQPAFGVQQQVDIAGQIRPHHVPLDQLVNGVDLSFRAAAPIELGLHQLELLGNLPHRFGQHVGQL